MRNNFSKVAIFLLLACGLALGQTTTTVTGTIRDLTQALVTSGKVTFELKPSRDTTIAGYARFSPQTITCLINASGLIKAQDGVSVCTLTMNTALQPTGTYYLVKVWPANVATSTFTFYAVLSTYDWSTVVPTPTTSPAQNFVDIFSNQSIGGNKTWLGSQNFSGAFTLTGTFQVNGGTFATLGEQIQVSGTGCAQALDLFNIDTAPTNPHKYFRVNRTTGALELVNSACNAVILSTDDAGNVTATNFIATNSTGLTGNSLTFHNITSAGAMTFLIDSGAGTGGSFNFTSGPGAGAGQHSGSFNFNVGTVSAGAFPGFLNTNTFFAKYNNVTTVGNGIPAEYAQVDLLGQSIAIPSTILYAGTATGQCRLQWYAKVTTVAGVSSTLGPLTIVYNDASDGIAQTITAPASLAAGTIATTATGNTTTTVLLGLPLMINCTAGSNVTYTFGYASNAAAAMQYELHMRLETL